jgi:hypothetical protein
LPHGCKWTAFFISTFISTLGMLVATYVSTPATVVDIREPALSRAGCGS